MERRKVIERMCKDTGIITLQEVHGNLEDCAVHLPQLASKFRIDVSECATTSAGGVVVLLNRKLVK